MNLGDSRAKVASRKSAEMINSSETTYYELKNYQFLIFCPLFIVVCYVLQHFIFFLFTFHVECHQSSIFKIVAQIGSITTTTSSIPLSTFQHQSMSRDRWTRTSNDQIILVTLLHLLFSLPVHIDTLESNYSSSCSTCSCTSQNRLQCP